MRHASVLSVFFTPTNHTFYRRQAWVASTQAPVESNPFPETTQRYPSRISLVFRPDMDVDDHLLLIYEGPWTPDGSVWFHIKVRFIEGARMVSRGTVNAASLEVRDRVAGDYVEGGPSVESFHDKGVRTAVVGGEGLGAGLSVTLRPEGLEQRKHRLEREETAAMGREDENSKMVGKMIARHESKSRGRKLELQEAKRLSKSRVAIFAARVRP